MKKILIVYMLLMACSVSAQVTIISDTVFEQVLIELGIDSDGIVNGQMATSDALNVTALTITSPDNDGFPIYINDLTGIEAFVNLESLIVNVTMIEELDVSNLINLRHLDCVDNMLTGLDVSNNLSLEYLKIFMGGDVGPMNNITEIDLSNNPNIHTLIAYGINYINLKNGNNNPNMYIDVNAGVWMDPEYVNGHTCIEVDDEALAQNNQYPYSEWIIDHLNQSYSLVASCLAETKEFDDNIVFVYPNPTSEILYLNSQKEILVGQVFIIDTSGRVVKEYKDISSEGILLSDLSTGTYLVKIVSGKNIQTEKVIIN